MTKGMLTAAVLGLGLVTLPGCAELGLYDKGPGFDSSSVVLRAAPDNRGNGRGNGGRSNGGGVDVDVGVSLNVDFGQVRRIALANNLTGYDSLPPGIRKNLARGKPLPPGIAKRAVPSPLLRELPVIEGHEWRISGTDLVLVALGTLVVVEILEGIFE